jgi:hypothetical protein
MSEENKVQRLHKWQAENPEAARAMFRENGLKLARWAKANPEAMKEKCQKGALALARWREEHEEEWDAHRKLRGEACRNPELPGVAACRLTRPDLQKGEQYFAARIWNLKSPKGVSFCFRNLSHFVRKHPELFDPTDVCWVSRRADVCMHCRASLGLASLSPARRRPKGTWKGWTWDYEAPFNFSPPV